jgi:membrane associated rhomboid family serine protease
VFPIRDNNPAPRFPIVTILLIVINLVVYFLQVKIQMRIGPELAEDFVVRHALVPARDFAPGVVSLKPYFASMFMHGGLFHVLFNLWTLWIFGDNVEGEMGPIRYLAFYLLCGLAAGFTHCYLEPQSLIPVVGASGAIAGVMGAYMFLFPHARLRMFTLLIFWPIFFEIPAFVFLIIWFVGQLASVAPALQSGPGTEDVGGVAFGAHVGGFVAGVVLLPFLRQRSKKRKLSRSR